MTVRAALARSTAATGLAIELPAGFLLARVDIGATDDRHTCGREAARRALAALGEDPAQLAYDGTRPIVAGGTAAISITHNRTTAFAVAARVSHLGIDVCDDDPRLPGLAHRFLVEERELADTPLALTACFAAKEAALKALGLGLVDGGVLDGTAVRVVSLNPPRLSYDSLHLVIARMPAGAVAVVYGT
jgi:phosphopantetheinyl transferase (holo-ACP synthase)